jgi:pyrimidine-specific ribonucleoside hydrolase
MKKILFVGLLFLNLPIFAQKKIWFDTDIMIGNPDRAPREVDDAITLMMTLKHQDKVKIEGISLITYVDYAYGITEKMLKWYGPSLSIPIYKGSDTCNDLGTENDATRALAAALKKEKLTILALGPATNVATVLKNHPELASQIEEIVFCAGRTPDFHFRPGLEQHTVSDYNFEKDVESFKVVFDSGVKVVLSGFECSVYLFLGKTDYDFLNNNFEGDKWVYDFLRPWSKRHEQLFGNDGFIPFDVTPLGYLTHPQYFKYYENIPVRIITKPNDATIPANRPKEKSFLEVSPTFDSKWKCNYAYKTLPGFEEIVLKALKREEK